VPDLSWNYATWNDSHGWEEDGEEWSAAWGGARSQWYGAIYPRINCFLPAGRILEIAPGYGRWTQFLLSQCSEYFGVDLSERCIDKCKRRFSSSSRVQFIKNDGQSLAMIPDDYIDFVFSLDSLVHAEADVLWAYTRQISRKLTRCGIAFLHHSNALGESVDPQEVRANARAESVSSSSLKDMIEDSGGNVLIQEEINWGSKTRIDCLTTFGREGAFANRSYVLIKNDEFMAEATLIQKHQSPYNFR
jgi:SAM-dependent methyltransferase